MAETGAGSVAQVSLEVAGPAWSNYVAGAWTRRRASASLPVTNPATREVVGSIADSTAEEVDEAVMAARTAFGEWCALSGASRASTLLRLADAIERRAAELAEAEVADNGKLYREMFAQLSSIPKWYRYFAGLADKTFGATIPLERQSMVGMTVREPRGVVACITPWNSPLLLSAFALAPALAAGNTVVVKPSEHASVSTLLLATCFEEAGFPPGVYNVVTGAGGRAGEALVAHSGVDCVAFTGSGVAGRHVAATASSHFAHVILELGGKSANMIFDDADLDAAIPGALGGMFGAAGQSCIAGSRLLVQRGVYDEVLERIRERVAAITVGDPMDAATEMGPLANEPQYEKTQEYVRIGRTDGARLLVGGRLADEAGPGFYIEPTVFCDVDQTMRLAREEVFGPILAVIPFDDEREAIDIANATEFGLAAGLWTRDLGRAHRVSRQLQAGTVWVNTYRALAPAMPFGGVKNSGLGRENGAESLLDFTQTKSIWIETEPTAADPFVMRV